MAVGSPFVGFRPYKEEEAGRFFGREADVRFALTKIDISGITILHAKTGVGKSSFINAGIIPALRAYDDVKIVVVANWKDGFFGALRDALNADGVKDTRSLREYVKKATSCSPREGSIIFVFDQFEEVLLYDKDVVVEASDSIAALVNTKTPAGVLISMREEFLAELEPLRERIRGLESGMLRLSGFSAEEATEVVQLVASVNANNVNWKADLSKEICIRSKDFTKRTWNSGYVHMGIVQIVSNYIWRNVTEGKKKKNQVIVSRKLLNRLGGIESIVDYSIEIEFNKVLSEEQQVLFASLSKFFYTLSGLRITVTLEDLSEYFNLNDIPPRKRRLVRRLIEKSDVDRPLRLGPLRNEVTKILNTLSDETYILDRAHVSRTGSDLDAFVVPHDAVTLLLQRWRERALDQTVLSNWLMFAQQVSGTGVLNYYFYDPSGSGLPPSFEEALSGLRRKVTETVSTRRPIRLKRKIPVTLADMLDDMIAYRVPSLDLAYRNVHREGRSTLLKVGTLGGSVLAFHKGDRSYFEQELKLSVYDTQSFDMTLHKRLRSAPSFSDVFEACNAHKPDPFALYCQTSTTIEDELRSISEDWIASGRKFARIEREQADVPYGSDRDIYAIFNNICYAGDSRKDEREQVPYCAIIDWPIARKLARSHSRYSDKLLFSLVRYKTKLDVGFFLPSSDDEFAAIVGDSIKSALITEGDWAQDFKNYAEDNFIKLGTPRNAGII